MTWETGVLLILKKNLQTTLLFRIACLASLADMCKSLASNIIFFVYIAFYVYCILMYILYLVKLKVFFTLMVETCCNSMANIGCLKKVGFGQCIDVGFYCRTYKSSKVHCRGTKNSK